MLIAGVLLATSAVVGATPVLPAGEIVRGGDVNIDRTGTAIRVTQASERAAIDWQSFSVGQGGRVDFAQPSAASVVLNRVIGNERSVIDGALSANGHMFLLNSNGILFSKDARIDVGGLIASTATMAPDDFMAGRYRMTDVGQDSVSNHGAITARDGGFVALLGRRVENDGVIRARLGQVVMAAGSQFTLTPNGSKFGVAVDGAVLAGLARNGNLIEADGGEVLLTAKGADAALSAMSSAVNHSGHISARTIEKNEGRIRLIGDGDAKVKVSGKVDASVAVGSIAKGGEVIISGGVAEGSVVSGEARVTLARGGKLLVEGPNVAIGTGVTKDVSQDVSRYARVPEITIAAGALAGALEGGDVEVRSEGEPGKRGDLRVDAPFGWSRNTLQLRSSGELHVNNVVTASGEAKLGMDSSHDFHPSLYRRIFKPVSTLFGSTGGTEGDRTIHMKLARNEEGRLAFAGRIDFPGRAGEGALTINGKSYTLIPDHKAFPQMALREGSSKAYALAGDIDMASTGDDTPRHSLVGDAEIPFGGTLDGLGHVIRNLEIKTSGDVQNPVGLFGAAQGALIRAVGLENARVTAPGSNEVAALVARLDGGRVSNSFASGTIEGNTMVGGVIGKASLYTTISDVHFDGTVSGRATTGGLVGHLANGVIDKSGVSGNVLGIDGDQTPESFGGLVGAAENSKMVNVVSATNVHAPDATAVGLLVGSSNGSTIDTAHWTAAEVTGADAVGLVGISRRSNVINVKPMSQCQGSACWWSNTTFAEPTTRETSAYGGPHVGSVPLSMVATNGDDVGPLAGRMTRGSFEYVQIPANITIKFTNETVDSKNLIGKYVSETGLLELNAFDVPKFVNVESVRMNHTGIRHENGHFPLIAKPASDMARGNEGLVNAESGADQNHDVNVAGDKFHVIREEGSPSVSKPEVDDAYRNELVVNAENDVIQENDIGTSGDQPGLAPTLTDVTPLEEKPAEHVVVAVDEAASAPDTSKPDSVTAPVRVVGTSMRNRVGEAEDAVLSNRSQTDSAFLDEALAFSAIAGRSGIDHGTFAAWPSETMPGHHGGIAQAGAEGMPELSSGQQFVDGATPADIVAEAPCNESCEAVTLAQARQMAARRGQDNLAPARFAVKANNRLLRMVDEGVALPPGVNQLMFLAPAR